MILEVILAKVSPFLTVEDIGKIFIILIIVYLVYVYISLDERFIPILITKWVRTTPRLFYWKPTISVLVLSTIFASISYTLFDDQATVFASILYASLFFLNETLRADHPYPNITEITDDTHEAVEYDRVGQSDGVVLVNDVTVRNNGYGDLNEFSLKYRVFPVSQNGKSNRFSGNITDDGWNECEDTMAGSINIPVNREKEFTIDIDLIGDEIESAKYHVLLKAIPPKNYAFLTQRVLHTMEFDDPYNQG